MARQVGHDEQKISVFFFDVMLVPGALRLNKFGGFFGNLVQDRTGVWPIEPNTSCALLQFDGPEKGRKT